MRIHAWSGVAKPPTTWTRRFLGLMLSGCLSASPIGAWAQAQDADEGSRDNGRNCAGWRVQGGPESDTTGLLNSNFPEASTTTYWTTAIKARTGSLLTVRGRFPFARFTGIEIYVGDRLIDHLADADIVPDPGQNNPFVSGTDNGTYTAYLVFGRKPATPAPNTLYAGAHTVVVLMYRIYHSTDPANPAGNARDPILPELSLDGVALANCAVRPFLLNPDSTPWGRLDNGDWIGTPPSEDERLDVSAQPVWVIADPYASHFFPNGANYYAGTTLSREFLHPFTDKTLYVVRFMAPTFPRTRDGEPINVARQVRFWSLCTDDPYTTNVNRCVPDDQALLDVQGYATFVVSDPGSRPSDEALSRFRANWLAWGALYLPTDYVYDRARRRWSIDTPVHFYNVLLYRQTLASPAFAQSFAAAFPLPPEQWPSATGPYWPVGGYCSTADFDLLGVGCVGR